MGLLAPWAACNGFARHVSRWHGLEDQCFQDGSRCSTLVTDFDGYFRLSWPHRSRAISSLAQFFLSRGDEDFLGGQHLVTVPACPTLEALQDVMQGHVSGCKLHVVDLATASAEI